MPYLLKHIYSIFAFLSVFSVFVTGCSSPEKHDDKAFEEAYGFLARGQMDSLDIFLTHLRPSLHMQSASGVEYYLLKNELSKTDLDYLKRYSDSALLFFKSESNKKKYPKLYSRALFVKGDYYHRMNLYNNALRYYSETLLQPEWSVNKAAVYHKVGLIYFTQSDYQKAAPYLSFSAQAALADTVGKTADNFFYKIQNSLNNAGLAYERAGNLDSAAFFYLKNKSFLHRYAPVIANRDLAAAAQIIMWDNLGNLYLKRGLKDSAHAALQNAISIPHSLNDGILIHPHIKLAKLAASENNRAAEAVYLRKAGAAIKSVGPAYLKTSVHSILDYNKLMSSFFLLTNQLDSARFYQNAYTELRDSLEQSNQSLYRLDIESELKNIQQNQAINQLNQENEMRLYYFLIALLCSILLTAILFLIKRNLHKTKVLQQTTERHNEELKGTLDELEKANQNYLRVMRVMAHDLKNPISGITGLSEVMIYEDGISASQKEMLELIIKTSINATSMINELLSAALNEDTEVRKEKGDLIALARDCVELLTFKAKEKQQTIVFRHTSETISYLFNFQEMSRALNNLLMNAIKFSYPESKIELSIQETDTEIVIAVKDEGIGIKDADKEQVFEMFTNAKRKGTNGETPFGLGLSITKKIVERHGGRISLESEEKKGTTFFICLPVNPSSTLHRTLTEAAVLN